MEPLPDFLQPLQYLTQPFPREAVEAAVERREESTPYLLDALEKADAYFDGNVLPSVDYMLPIFAMHLLAQFRETRAYPLIVRLFRRPEHEEVTGELSTSSLAQLLASVCGGDLGPIKSLVEEPGLDEWVRGSALESLGVLADAGQLPREDLSAYLGTLFAGKLEREPNHVWNSVTAVCMDARLTEHLESIRQLYRDQIADETYMGLEEVETEIVLPPGESPYPQSLLPKGLIDSAVTEMEWWDCFRVRTPEEKEKERLAAEREDDLFASLEGKSSVPLGTYVRESPKVGRNDPCPCGNGRKFKKCCGAAA